MIGSVAEGGEFFSLLEISGITLVGVCLFLEGDGAISLVGVAGFYKEPYPFRDVEDVERDIEEFAHLGCMDGFMVEHHGVAGPFGKDDAEKVDCIIFLAEREDSVVDHFHKP